MDHRDLISCLVLIAVAVFVCIQSIYLGTGTLSSPGPGLLLFLSSLALGGLSILLIILHFLKKGPTKKILDVWRGLDWKSVLLAVIALLLYPVLLPKVGYLITSFVSLIILFGLGRMKPWIILTTTLATTLASYIIFRFLLGVPFP